MFNFATICESVKRHWIVIAIVTVLALAAGVVSSLDTLILMRRRRSMLLRRLCI